MRLRNMIKKEPVHERTLELKSYPLENDKLIVEGRLLDQRKVRIHHWSGKVRDPGVVHLMTLRILVGGWPLTIEDAEAEIHDAPYELCPQTEETVRKVIGMPIASGFSEAVKNRLGGVEGCNHLTHMLVVMGPAALHGFWTQASRKPRPAPKSLDDVPALDMVINTCRLWAEDGPLVDMIKARFENGPDKGGPA